MKIMHHIGSYWEESDKKYLAEFGISVNLGHGNIQLEENNLYFQLEPFFIKSRVVNIPYTIYTDEESDRAEILHFYGPISSGYPQPEGDGTYKNKTYNLENYCYNCGIGKIQNNPFRFKKAPNWKNKMLGLNWIPDEIFVQKDFFERVFAPYNIDSSEVVVNKTGKIVDNVVQLILPQVQYELNMEGVIYEKCEHCRRIKFEACIRGFLPKYDVVPNEIIFKGKEYYGSGCEAYNRIYMKQELRQILIKEKAVRPDHFAPLI